jgi:hypothetical protein
MGKKEKDKGGGSKAKSTITKPLETQRDYVLCGAVLNSHVSGQAAAAPAVHVGAV